MSTGARRRRPAVPGSCVRRRATSAPTVRRRREAARRFTEVPSASDGQLIADRRLHRTVVADEAPPQADRIRLGSGRPRAGAASCARDGDDIGGRPGAPGRRAGRREPGDARAALGRAEPAAGVRSPARGDPGRAGSARRPGAHAGVGDADGICRRSICAANARPTRRSRSCPRRSLASTTSCRCA